MQFTGDGIQNCWNQHLWAGGYTHAILPSHQQLFSINVWVGICDDSLFGPHVFPNRLTGQNYKPLLVSNMPNFFADIPLVISLKTALHT
jgi:hypothetical protein